MRNPRRVAIICDYDLDYLGGAQTALLQQAAALVSAKCEVIIISPSSPTTWQRVGVTGVDHLVVPSRWTLPVFGLPIVSNNARTRHRIRSILIDRGIEVCHLHSEFGVAAATIDVADQLHLPVLHTVHTFFWQAPIPNWSLLQIPAAFLIRGFHQKLTRVDPIRTRLAAQPVDSALRNMTRTIAARASGVISPSEHQARQLANAGLENVDVIANTMVAADEPAAPLTAVDQPVKIIWIGRCAPEKRILPFIHATVQAIDRIGAGQLRVDVVGDGPQLKKARKLATGYADISFLGRRPHEQMAELLAGSDVLALTSQGFDNQPMTIVEAVMALRGVIYCDSRLAEGLSGTGIWTSGTTEALSETLIELVHRPERILEASRAALQTRGEFSPQCQATKTVQSYQRAAARI